MAAPNPPPNKFYEFFADKTPGNPLDGSQVVLKGNIGLDMENNGVPDSKEGRIFISLAYVAALIPGSKITRDFKTVDELTVTSKFPRGYTPTLDANGKDLERGPKSKNGDLPSFLGARDNPNDFGDYNLANAVNILDPEMRSLINTVAGGYQTWKTWFYDLLGASQVVNLTPNHIKSYCEWADCSGIDGNFLSMHFPSLKSGFPKIAEDKEMREAMTKGKWIEYRLTFATSVGLLQKMLEECPTEHLTVFSNETVNLIEEASKSYWSEEAYRKIPTKALGVLYAYLLATDQKYDGLWGPKRAYEEMTLSEKESLREWFTEAKGKIKSYKSGPLGNKMPSSLLNL